MSMRTTHENTVKNAARQNDNSQPIEAAALIPASLFRRLAAFIYDSLVVVGIAFVVTNIYLTAYHALFGLEPKALNPTLLQTTLFPFILFATALFFLWFWTHGGRTLGMRAWHLRLVTREGGAVNITQALKRLIFVPLSLLPFGMGYLASCFNATRCSWHDRLSQTRLILDKSRH